jgi:hypothetical protein
MNKSSKINFNASDVLGALALEANRIVAAADHFASGAPFPDADQIRAVVERMLELNEVLIEFKRTMIAMEVEKKASGATH